MEKILFSIMMLIAFAVAFLFPRREVTQPAGRRHFFLELLFPGTAPAWSLLGGFVLLAWCYFVIQDLLIFRFSSPYILTFISTPSVFRAYGIAGDEAMLYQLLNPGQVWVYAAPLALFAVNLFVVLLTKGKTERSNY